MFPRISIIMPSYNSGQYIGQAIQSVIDQTFTDWELIVVDDGSTDEAVEMVRRYLGDPRIQLHQQENQGASAARNKAMQISRGSFIAFLDSDDLWAPDKLSRQLEVFEQYPDIGVCATGIHTIDSKGVCHNRGHTRFFHGIALPRLLYDLSIPMSSSVVRKAVFEKVGVFDLQLPCAMDYDFWLRASVDFPFYTIPENLTFYRSGHDSISLRMGDKRREIVMSRIVPRFLNEYGGSKYVKWYHVWKLHSICYFGRASSQKQVSHKLYWLLRSLLCYPMNRDALGALFRVFFPKRKAIG